MQIQRHCKYPEHPRSTETRPTNTAQIAGFFTGGALAIRGGYKAARNGAISCAILLAVIEGVGIGFQKMFAGATKLEVCVGGRSPTGDDADSVPGTATTPHGRKDARIINSHSLSGSAVFRHTQLFSGPAARPGRVFLYAFMTVSILVGAFPVT